MSSRNKYITATLKTLRSCEGSDGRNENETILRSLIPFVISTFSFIGKFELHEVGSEVIQVRWNPRALSGGDVYAIQLEAHPKNTSLPVAITRAQASAGRASITGELLKSSTVYIVRVVDTHNRGFEYTLGEVTTLPIGELSHGSR